MENEDSFFKNNNDNKNEEYIKLEYDENNVIHIDDIPKFDFDMKYYSIDEKYLKYVDKMVRKTFEYRELFKFIKQVLDVNHCSYYKDYSMKDNYTIELHHSPFTLYDIVEAVASKQLSRDGYVCTFKITEEVTRLHYQFKVGLTPLNPTAHKLVHNQVLPIHPKIILGYWKEFYGEYNAYLGKTALNHYDEVIDLENKIDNPSVPKIMEYDPVKIEMPINMITSKEFNKIVIEPKLNSILNIESME